MKRNVTSATHFWLLTQPVTKLAIQAPLPDFLHTLPILHSIKGQGTARERAAPLAPPEPSPNE